MKTQWIHLADFDEGDTHGDEHTSLCLGLRKDGTVVWQKEKVLHPDRCPKCNGYASGRGGRYKLCPECGEKLTTSEVVGGIDE